MGPLRNFSVAGTMHLPVVVVLAAAVLALHSCAAAEEQSSSSVPVLSNSHFYEGFDEDWESRWHIAAGYPGVWERTEGEHVAIEGDTGLSMTSRSAKHGVATKFS